eukprot:6417054-Prymnesium_polylepis.3
MPVRALRVCSVGTPDGLVPASLDKQRNESFADAVKGCIEAYMREQKSEPHVLDFGCGSGRLALEALRNGASFVTAVDVNEDMRNITTSMLVKEGFREGVHFSLFSSIEDATSCTDVFDVMVSDLTHTLADGAFASFYWQQIAPFMRRTDRGWYTVPQSLTQHVRIVRFDLHDEAARCVFMNAFGMCTGREMHLFATHETQLPFYLMPCEALSERMLVDTIELGGADAYVTRSGDTEIRFPPFDACDSTFALFEWEATLWEDIMLKNTLDEYKRLTPQDASCRAQAWGFMIGHCAPGQSYLPTFSL